MVIVLMGPAGAGKTTVGAALGERLGWPLVDADDYHAASSVARMAAGRPLTDDDRSGWLARLRQVIVKNLERRENLVLACSALTRGHRDALAGGLRGVRFVYLKADRTVLNERLASRHGHFAGPELLDSQLATLEEPLTREALIVDATGDIDTIIGYIRLEFGV
jgi:gluconokinase